MDPFDIDMELLRRVGAIRQAAEGLTTGATTREDLSSALASAASRAPDDLILLGRLLNGLDDGAGNADIDDPAMAQAVAAVVTSVEAYLVALGEKDAEERLAETALPALRALGIGGEWPGAAAGEAQAAVLDDLAFAVMRAMDGAPEDVASVAKALSGAALAHPRLAEVSERLREATRGGDVEIQAVLSEAGEAVEAEILAAEASEAGDTSTPSRPKTVEPPASDGTSPASPAATASAAAPQYDLELLADFLAEGQEHLEMAEAALLTLEEDPTDGEAVNVVFRAFHTIKGVAGFLELTHIADLAHHAESLLSRVRDGEVAFTSGIADLTLRSADVMQALLEGVRPVLEGGAEQAPPGIGAVMEALGDESLITRLARPDGPSSALPAPSTTEEPTPDATTSAARGSATISRDGGPDSSVRVSTARLDGLVDLVGELVVAHSMVAQDPSLRTRHEDLVRKISRSGKILRELQDLSTSLRMVPLRGAFRKIARVVRDLSRRSGKPVRLVTEGEGTELDRNMVNVITDPLVHMIRNAVDHGLEDAKARAAAGKESRGEVRLSAFQEGGSVVIEVSDDGRGLDRDRILQKACDRGIVQGEHTMDDQEVFALIFAAGFSTAETVTEISGRGVGMDVVRRSVESLRGRIEVSSTPGEGTCFRIRLPLTTAITEGMLLAVGSERYIVPIGKIEEAVRPQAADLSTVSGRGELVRLHGRLVPLIRLHRVYAIEEARQDPTEGLLVVVGAGSRRAALMVDEIIGQQHFVVKPLSGNVAGTPGVAGAAILGDGSVGLILEPDEIVSLARSASVDEATTRTVA